VHKAVIPSDVETDIYLAWDNTALYIGFVGHDDDPDAIKAFVLNEDEQIWYDDVVEIFMDASHDYQNYVHMGINSLGVSSDAWVARGLSSKDDDWDADMSIGANVGAAEWTLELAIRFDDLRLPRPLPGAAWGFNFVRTYRGSEYSQWVRTFGGGGHMPDDFGFLVFQEKSP